MSPAGSSSEELYTKTGLPVINVLRSKHLETHVPNEDMFDHYAVDKDAEEEAPPIYCFEEDEADATVQLVGTGGPMGVNGRMLKNGSRGTRYTQRNFVKSVPIRLVG